MVPKKNIFRKVKIYDIFWMIYEQCCQMRKKDNNISKFETNLTWGNNSAAAAKCRSRAQKQSPSRRGEGG